MIIFPAQIGLTIIGLLQWCFQSYIQDSGITLQLLLSYTSVWIGGNKCTCRNTRKPENRGQRAIIYCLTLGGWVKHHPLGPVWPGKHLAPFQGEKRCSLWTVSVGMLGSAAPCPCSQLWWARPWELGSLALDVRNSLEQEALLSNGRVDVDEKQSCSGWRQGEGGRKPVQWMGLRMASFILFQEETRLNPLL